MTDYNQPMPVVEPEIDRPLRNGYVKIVLRRPGENDTGYIGAQSSYDALPGEDHRRGNDLPDGKWSEETIDRIAAALKQIVRGERT